MRIDEEGEDICENYENDSIIDIKLEKYFKGSLKEFDIDVLFESGTDFQVSVWKELLKIPYGETRNYQEIAVSIGRPKALRAVGQACKKNPIGIVVPCHRVIGKDNKLTGYSGKNYIHLKKKLLDMEKAGLN